MSCLYTAQGVVVCSDKEVEHFVEEKGNIISSTNNNMVISAIQNKYCEITALTDPLTKNVSYTFKKECKK